MKLKDLFSDLKLSGERTFFEGSSISGQELEPIKEWLLETDEFKDVDELIIVKQPAFELNGKNMVAPSRIIDDSTKFKKRAYLYAINTTPELYNPENSGSHLDEFGMIMSPPMYDPINFNPYRDIKIRLTGDEARNTVDIKEILYKKVDELTSDLEKFSIKPEARIMVRGIFEYIESDSGIHEDQILSNINLEPDSLMVTYIDTVKDDNKDSEVDATLKLEVKTEFIPGKYKDKFIEEFPSLSGITKEDIDGFLNRMN